MRFALPVLTVLLLSSCVADGHIPCITSLARKGNELHGHMWTAKGDEPAAAVLVQGKDRDPGFSRFEEPAGFFQWLGEQGAHIAGQGPVRGGDFTIPLDGVDTSTGHFGLAFAWERSGRPGMYRFALLNGTTAIVQGQRTYYTWKDNWPAWVLIAGAGAAVLALLVSIIHSLRRATNS
jgi:hypothetical protein